MQDKLEKLLRIKIDAIKKNIDNLNYLNGELDKNNEDLKYIKEMISLFKNNELLNFDKVSQEDFERILLMIDPSITDIFKNKTCSYEGIIYIIEGIRKSISLQLTEEQSNAILAFIEGMRKKSLNLEEVISNLHESKERLPETNLNTLSFNLDNYQNIVSKLENNLYLTEIDEIEESLEFSNTSVEEKADMFEYLLKYNATIYSEKEKSEESIENFDTEENYSFDLPTFHYEPLEVNQNSSSSIGEGESSEEKEKMKIEEDNKESNEESFLEDANMNLDHIVENEMPNQEDVELPPIDDITFPSLNNLNNLEPTNAEIPIETNNTDNDTQSDGENHELNTVELEDIIKKIDARLKEMETSESNAIEHNMEEPLTALDSTSSDYSEVFEKYDIPKLSIQTKTKEEIDSILSILTNYNILEELKKDETVLSQIISLGNSERIEEIISLIKENLLVKSDELNYVLEIVIKTMPILFVKEEVLTSFKENLTFFKENKINIINLFDNYRELLIMNHEKIEENYRKIKSYDLELNNDNVKYYLYNRNILNNIDSYIEAVGYEKGFLGRDEHFDGINYIKKNPYKLNEINKEVLMKLRYSSENGKKIYGNKPGILSGEISNSKVDILTLPLEYKNSYFNGEYHFLDNNQYSELKKEIDELSDFDLTLDGNINKLDSAYKQGNLRYQFGNILVSRVKTIRLYNFLKTKNISLKNALLIALTYNTVLKMEEYDKIEKVVDNVVEGGI